MTENQSVIEEIEMNNCGGKTLKFFADWPLTSGCQRHQGHGVCRTGGVADIRCFIHDPKNQLH
ncbi:MAG: hypothetical protein LBJ65_17640 [Burkholderia sp.]|uniref:hypothetical protein n=1 Tax=Burkholderia sp. TaxID=36773 RepID=UPI0028214ED2|nr:hypothetical protein [Burkholderia sp.]MDR0243419.1 hypothetical protein [Burkholderia sp.]